MKVLFIYAKQPDIREKAASEAERLGVIREYARDDVQMPLGTLWMAAVVEKAGIPVEVRDDAVHTEEEILEALGRADVVGVSALTPNAPRGKHWCRVAKAQGKKVLIGGPHATSCPEYFLDEENGPADVAVRHECEDRILDIIQRIDDEAALREMKGITFRTKSGEIVKAPDAALPRDLDRIPFPARHLVPVERYFRALGFRGILAMTSRGCPWNCIYCNKEMSPRKYRVHSPKYSVDELEMVVKEYRVEHLQWIDDLFTGDRDRVFAICDEVRRRKLHTKVSWAVEARVDTVDYPMLRAMKRAGCSKIHYGVESGSPRSLKMMKKKATVEDIVKAATITRQARLYQKFFILIGFPWETMEDIKATEDMFRKAQPNMIAVSLLNPMPGTEVYDTLLREGKLTSHDWSEHHYYHRGEVFKHEHFTNEELKEIRERMTTDYMRFFHSPQQRAWRKLQQAKFFVTHPMEGAQRVALALTGRGKH